MVIGIDITQMMYTGTGVARYVDEMTRALILNSHQSRFVLFAASIRRKELFKDFIQSLPSEAQTRVSLKFIPLNATIMDLLWNVLHIIPVEVFTGRVDFFWSSDWTQPPLKHATGITTIHDLTPKKFPETFSKKIIQVHQRKLKRSIQECSLFFCDSNATKEDAMSFLQIPASKLFVIYPGYKM